MSTSYDPRHEAPRDRRGTPDNRDPQDRNRDGVADRVDRNRDGVPDRMDRDRDGDGVPDRMDRDRDGDGVPDRMDRDRDGIPDRQQHVDPTVRHDVHDQPTVVAPAAATAADLGLDRRTVVARERAEFGGIKIGSAFFGWLTATGMAVLLTALLAGIGVAVGLTTETEASQAADEATRNPESVGLAGALALIVILFVSYYCGGYVAGRMARFNGIKQGLAVWLWAILIAVVVAVIAAVAGDKFDVLARLNGFPRLPVNEGELPLAAIVTALALAASSLVGAILGGLGGMRFHRRVDRAGLEPVATPHHDS